MEYLPQILAFPYSMPALIKSWPAHLQFISVPLHLYTRLLLFFKPINGKPLQSGERQLQFFHTSVHTKAAQLITNGRDNLSACLREMLLLVAKN